MNKGSCKRAAQLSHGGSEKKTELCLFHRKIPPVITILVGGQLVKSSNQMNVLGVMFDSTLNWAQHVNKVLMKANSTKYAIRMIANYSTIYITIYSPD